MVDDTDRAVIDALLGEGRASAREIATETDIAATTVSRRMDRLADDGPIDSYTVNVDYEALGYDVTAVFRLSVEGDGLESVTEELSAMPTMISVYEVTGTDDIVAIGKFRTTERMNERIKQLLTDENIRSVATDVVLGIVTEFDQFAIDVDD